MLHLLSDWPFGAARYATNSKLKKRYDFASINVKENIAVKNAVF
jgi:hypothetical protein